VEVLSIKETLMSRRDRNIDPIAAVEEETLRLQRENARLRSANEHLQKVKVSADGLRMAVSLKGGISVYDMGRFPVTLYRDQWERIIAGIPQLQEFIETNKNRLKEYKAGATSHTVNEGMGTHAGKGEANG